jgi:hypothetical protein
MARDRLPDAVNGRPPRSIACRSRIRVLRATAEPAIDADMIASFLLLPHATMPNLPLSRKDAQDIALFIVKMKK